MRKGLLARAKLFAARAGKCQFDIHVLRGIASKGDCPGTDLVNFCTSIYRTAGDVSGAAHALRVRGSLSTGVLELFCELYYRNPHPAHPTERKSKLL